MTLPARDWQGEYIDQAGAGHFLKIPHHRRLGGAGADAVDAHALFDGAGAHHHRPYGGHLLREAIAVAHQFRVGGNPGLGRGKVWRRQKFYDLRQMLAPGEARRGGDRGDRAALADARQPGFGPQPQADEIDPHNRLCREGLRQAGAIEQHVDLAIQRGGGGRNRFGLGQVERVERGHLDRRGTDVEAVQFGAQPHQFARGSLAHARGAASDNHTFACKAPYAHDILSG